MSTRSNAVPRLARRGLTAVLLALALAAGAGAGELKAPQSPFSAELRVHTGDVSMDAKLWYDGGRERREMTMQGKSTVVLIRPDRNAAFMLSADEKTAMQMALTPELRYFDEATMADLKPELVGRDTVNGEPTRKYRLDGVSLLGGRIEGHLWVTDDFIVMKIEGRAQVQGKWQDVELSLDHLKRGPVAPAQFEVPAGYQVMKLN